MKSAIEQVNPAPLRANKQKYAFPVDLVGKKLSQVTKVTCMN